MNFLKVSEESAKIAIILSIILGISYSVISLVGTTTSLISKVLSLLFVLGFGFFFLWISAFVTYFVASLIGGLYLLSFFLCTGIGVCLAMLSLKFSEIFFISDLYFYVFFMLGILGGMLVFWRHRKMN